jgi:hypothetical protein
MLLRAAEPSALMGDKKVSQPPLVMVAVPSQKER